MFDRSSVQQLLRRDMAVDLVELREKYGFIFELGSARFSTNDISVKLTITDLSKAPAGVTNPRELAFIEGVKRAGLSYGVTVGDINKKVTIRGLAYTFVGLSLRNHKYPYIYREVRSGRTIKSFQNYLKK